jgi:phosphoribosylglycinamide formyltransferase-1
MQDKIQIMNNIAIFASGSGTNAENIIKYFQNHVNVRVRLVLSNRSDAFVLERAKNLNIPTKVFSRQEFFENTVVDKLLEEAEINFIVLAGFLLLIPQRLLDKYPGKIVNIHPALLPKYGGKGMYGMKVHEAIAANKEKESGITIHYVDPMYDNGKIIFQERFPVEEGESAEQIAMKVHKLEYEFYPRVIEKILMK